MNVSIERTFLGERDFQNNIQIHFDISSVKSCRLVLIGSLGRKNFNLDQCSDKSYSTVQLNFENLSDLVLKKKKKKKENTC